LRDEAKNGRSSILEAGAPHHSNPQPAEIANRILSQPLKAREQKRPQKKLPWF
jgi:hypothetical protein